MATSVLPSPLVRSDPPAYSECLIQNQMMSYMRERKMPRTSILNLVLEIISMLNIMQRPRRQTVRLRKSGLRNITNRVMIVQIQSTHHVNWNHGIVSSPALLASLEANSSICYSTTCSLASISSSLLANSGGMDKSWSNGTAFFASSK